MTADDKHLARQWGKAAELMTRDVLHLTTDEWRRFRRWQTELGPPEIRDGEIRRRTRSGAVRVDRIDS